jgi:flagellar hook-associated protein 2
VHNPQDAFDALYSLGLATQKMLDDNTEITPTGRKSSDMRIEYKGSGAADGSSVETAMNIKFEAPTSKEQADAQNALVKAVNSDNVSVSVKDDGAGGKVAEFSLKGYVIEDSGETFESDGQTYKTLNIYKADANGNKTGDVVATGYTTRNNISDNVTAGETINSLNVAVSGGSTASYEFANKIDGSDSSITLNGVEYTGTTNSFSINGLSINALAKTDGDITITTTTDTQAIYDKIKDFLTEYNSVINEMTKLYNADSSYGYDPLTDDEKDAMSDTEIEKWETKIKDSLLRNDTTLNGVMMAMINSMSTAYTINGQKYSLSTFGIGTLGYLNAVENENYAYHIDGDSDDDNTSSKDDKLMTAITEDPDTVIEFMKQLTSGLYTSLGNKMKSTTLSSAYTIYNDKEMNSQYSEYSKTISKWEDKLSDKEDYYYNKFSKMESALTTLQSQSSAVSGLFSS